MKQELEKQLVDIAPYMFRYDGWNNIQTGLLGFGFECGDGWYELLKDLIKEIKQIDVDETVHVIQVKEKFGGLRFYIDITDTKSKKLVDDIYKCIQKAEERSEITCEHCGKPAKISGETWLRCECDECKKLRESVLSNTIK